MKNVLVIYAHPFYENSKSNKALLDSISNEDHVTIHNLATEYPDGKIDIAKEQALLSSFDHIIFQYPTFWFNIPGLLKTWIDEVFAYGWAYGPNGTALAGKKIGVVTTTGGTWENYQKEGVRGFTAEEIILPVKGSIEYVDAEYLGSVVLHNALAPTKEQVDDAILNYKKLILR